MIGINALTSTLVITIAEALGHHNWRHSEMLKVSQFHILHNYQTKEMQEEPEGRRRRSTSTCEREDGKKRMFSILFSWFFSSKNGGKSTKDQVLKPMYEIVSDVASELMEATVESIEEVSIDKKLTGARTVRQSQPQQKGTRRSRFLRRVMNLFKKSRGILCK